MTTRRQFLVNAAAIAAYPALPAALPTKKAVTDHGALLDWYSMTCGVPVPKRSGFLTREEFAKLCEEILDRNIAKFAGSSGSLRDS
jgi:hypothetical protein